MPEEQVDDSSHVNEKWGETFLDTVMKFERDSERQLFVHGISWTRCHRCRFRIRNEKHACERCKTPVDRLRKCKACGEVKLSLWCYECDAYYCAACHPHKTDDSSHSHHVYAVEGASGKLFAKCSWSPAFLETMKAMRRVQEESNRVRAVATEAQATPEQQQLQEAMEQAKPLEIPATSSTSASNGVVQVDPKTNSVSLRQPVAGVAAISRRTEMDQQRRKNSEPAARQKPQAPAAARKQPSPARNHPPAATKPSPQAPHTAKAPAPNAGTPSSSSSTTIVRIKSEPPSTQSNAQAQGTNLPIEAEVVRSSPSRKRKLPSPTAASNVREQAAPSAPAHPSASAQAAASSSMDGLSLYERVRRMHELHLQQRPNPTPTQAHAPTQPAPAPVPAPSAAERIPASHAVPQHHSAPLTPIPIQSAQSLQPRHQSTAVSSMTQGHAPSYPSQAAAHNPGSRALPMVAQQQPQHQLQQQHLQVPATASPPTAQSQMVQQQPRFDMESIRALADEAIEALPQPIDLTRELPAVPPSSMTQSTGMASHSIEDPLRAAMEDEYNMVNVYVLKLEHRLSELNTAVMRVSKQDMQMAAKLNQRIGTYRTILDKANARRSLALVRVVLFSPDLRSMVRNIPGTNLSDVPHVLTACHKQCAHLANTIRECHQQMQQLRHAIDDAITSGDTTKLQNLQLYGNMIAEREQQIANGRSQRAKQFVLMVQYSRHLRDLMQSELTAINQTQTQTQNKPQNANQTPSVTNGTGP